MSLEPVPPIRGRVQTDAIQTDAMKTNAIDPTEFLDVVRPALAACDPTRLAHVVRIRWRPHQICRLLRRPEDDVRRVAAVALGLVGDMSCTPALTRALRDQDEQVNQMAEHGLWSVWFRSGRPEAVDPFRAGLGLLSTEDYDRAVTRFRAAFAADPQFAEAYNQCGIARYFLGQWDACIKDCEQAIRLVPTHFGAIAGMGHACAQNGDLGQALRCYRQAVWINPRMTGIHRAIDRLERGARLSESSGEFLLGQELN